MRSSRYSIFMYGSILGIPALLMLIIIGTFIASPYANTLLPALLFIALLVFGIFGFKEIYIHKDYPRSKKILKEGIEEVNKEAPKNKSGEEVSIVLKRFNNATTNLDSSSYKFYANKLTTVLGAILDIKAYQDNTVSIRCNCRMGICGSCGVVINGKPMLACEANLLKVAENGVVEVAPMEGHPLLKDVVNDFGDFFERHRSVDPSMYRENEKEREASKHEYRQSKEELDRFLPYSYCIMCGLCMDACPVVNSNPNFIGPQALSQVYRYHADSRDQKGKKRLFDVDSEEGAWGCEFSGSCSKACPKGVDPASAIQLIKGDLMQNIFDKE